MSYSTFYEDPSDYLKDINLDDLFEIEIQHHVSSLWSLLEKPIIKAISSEKHNIFYNILNSYIHDLSATTNLFDEESARLFLEKQLGHGEFDEVNIINRASKAFWNEVKNRCEKSWDFIESKFFFVSTNRTHNNILREWEKIARPELAQDSILSPSPEERRWIQTWLIMSKNLYNDMSAVGFTNNIFYDSKFGNPAQLIYSHLDEEVSVMLSHLKGMKYHDVQKYYTSNYLNIDNLSKAEVGYHLLDMIDNNADEFDITLARETYKETLSYENGLNKM